MKHVTPIVSDKEMLRQYSEVIKSKDAEIERLEGLIFGDAELATKLKWAKETYDTMVKSKDAEIERLETRVSDLTRDCIYGHKALLTRAANALEETHVGKAGLGCQVCDLIQELREATK